VLNLKPKQAGPIWPRRFAWSSGEASVPIYTQVSHHRNTKSAAKGKLMTSNQSQSPRQKTIHTTVSATEKVSTQVSAGNKSPRPMTGEEYIESIRDGQDEA
jgi:hypothetical protein